MSHQNFLKSLEYPIGPFNQLLSVWEGRRGGQGAEGTSNQDEAKVSQAFGRMMPALNVAREQVYPCLVREFGMCGEMILGGVIGLVLCWVGH